ncbi:Hypothetical protein FKW44_006624 [Caligus rogercresseyi]|uniref:Uncharacterized protein n=1 Tax=Caligus rogercresseyi TaxID=217165 RepID=A0A7T8KDM0_CALRO|nr:Hypothetical protein FKW44_006624 [Caligus rogercresseyi]
MVYIPSGHVFFIHELVLCGSPEAELPLVREGRGDFVPLLLLLSQGRPSHQSGGRSNIWSIWGDANPSGLACVDLAYLSGSL